MQLFLAILGLVDSFVEWIKGNKDRRIGADEQKVKDLSAVAKVNADMAQASEQAPRTRQELEDDLSKGNF